MYRLAVRAPGKSVRHQLELILKSDLSSNNLKVSSANTLCFRVFSSIPAKSVKRVIASHPTNFYQNLLSNPGITFYNASFRSFASASLPQHTTVALPALSPTMERGVIKSWEKKEGDKLSEGDLLALIETDKATMDFETPEEGYLAKIIVPGGSKDVPLGAPVCIIVQNQEDVAAFKNYTPPDDAGKKSGQEVKKSSEVAEKKDGGEKSGGIDSSSKYPSHLQVLLPALSPTVDKSTIKNWNKKEGEKLSEGDLIAQVETDKATIDWNWENPEDTYIAKIFVPDGTADVPVGQLVAIFVNNKADLAAFKDVSASDFGGSTKKPSASKPPKEDAPQPEKRSAPKKQESSDEEYSKPSKRQDDGRVFASPLARSLAKAKGIDLSDIKGTGPEGRIVAEDINKFEPGARTPGQKQAKAAAGGADGSSFQDFPLTNIRQVIAKRLLHSKQTVPHYYLSVDIVLDEVLSLRKDLNEMLVKDKVKISVNDFIIKASALACKKVPPANSSWMDSFIRQYNTVDVSVAVSTDAGLITPIVFNADSKGLVDINNDVVRLADAARKGKLKPHEFQGGTFTVSNLGMFDIKNFSAVINPPQSCILAVGGAQKQLIADDKTKEGFRIATMMSVTLSCDHRVVDGAVGAQWLKHFKQCLEHPETMLL